MGRVESWQQPAGRWKDWKENVKVTHQVGRDFWLWIDHMDKTSAFFQINSQNPLQSGGAAVGRQSSRRRTRK